MRNPFETLPEKDAPEIVPGLEEIVPMPETDQMPWDKGNPGEVQEIIDDLTDEEGQDSDREENIDRIIEERDGPKLN